MNHLEHTDLKDKKVGLRVDLNVPIENGEILSHERLSAALPSILYILKHTKKLCVITHLGRPKEGEFDIDLSVLPIKKWFEKGLNEEIALINNFENIPDNVCFMENIRFFNGENDNDKKLSEQIAKAFDVMSWMPLLLLTEQQPLHSVQLNFQKMLVQGFSFLRKS